MASIFLLGVSHEGTGQLTLVTCLQPFKRPNDDSMTQDPPLINHRISIDSLAFGGPGSYVSKDTPFSKGHSIAGGKLLSLSSAAFALSPTC